MLHIGLEKPPKLGIYDDTYDLDEHIENINAFVDYRGDPNVIKYRLFLTTMRQGAMTWYKSLPDESITSWKGFNKLFSRHFTASPRHPKFKAFLEATIQGKEEPLRAYIKRFNKEVVQVSTTTGMKKYLLERGFRPYFDFDKAVGIETLATLDVIFLMAHAYISSTRRKRPPTRPEILDIRRILRVSNMKKAPLGELIKRKKTRTEMLETTRD